MPKMADFRMVDRADKEWICDVMAAFNEILAMEERPDNPYTEMLIHIQERHGLTRRQITELLKDSADGEDAPN